MINRRCPNPQCNGSTNTYAVPSRAIIKKDENDKAVVDERTGLPLKIMMRRCRNCGEDYLDDGKGPAPRIPTGAMGELIKKLQQERSNDKTKV
jgi:hypothetical protein